MALTWGKWEMQVGSTACLLHTKSTCLNAFLFVFVSYKIQVVQEYLK